LVLLVALLGGLAIGAAIAARRTQSSFPRFLASTNPSALTATTFTNGGYDAAVVHSIRRIRGVKSVESVAGLAVAPLDPNGAAQRSAVEASNEVLSYGSVDGLYFDQDRVAVTKGRMANPDRADEVIMTPDAARLLGVHVGERLPIGVYANTHRGQSRRAGVSTLPHSRLTVTIVGLVVFSDGVVRDDAFRFPTYVLLTPALTRPLLQCCAFSTTSGIQFHAGKGAEAAVQTAVERILPHGSTFYFRAASVVETQVERATRPEAVALAVFAAIAFLAALLIASQVIGREMRSETEELLVMRSLGATPAMTAADIILGIIGAVIVGAILAATVAIALSVLGPIGPIRSLDPRRGLTVDWIPLGIGVLLLVGVLGTVAVMRGFQCAPPRAMLRDQRAGPRRPGGLPNAAVSGLPPSAREGIRFALEPRRPSNPLPARSAILGAALALMLVVSTAVFGASLNALVSRPALYGWNWDYELNSRFGGSGNIPQHQAANLLNHNAHVKAWAGVYFDTMRIDDQTVPILGTNPDAPVQPPILAGHMLHTSKQVVLGAATLNQLHKHIGQTVDVRYATTTKPTRLQIVGTATLPAIGPGGGLHLSMGTGAMLDYHLIPFTIRNGGGPTTGPNAILVRLRHNTDRGAAHRSLQQLAVTLDSPTNGPVSLLTTQRPAEIVNYHSMGSTPILLASTLALGAATALTLALTASTRHRRRDLAILKALGFTHRQLGAVIAWQSTILVAIGTFIGVPLGIILGRDLWIRFAQALHVVPAPHASVLTTTLIVLSAQLLAIIIAAHPARQAARTTATIQLHTE
jgi:hypothetical protein